jgi:tRNA G18 (ribose-2'-O)-methylase SpoU
MVDFEYVDTPDYNMYKKLGYRIVGLEQDKNSILLNDYKSSEKIVLILGEEVHGITQEIKSICDDLIEIPMFGKKESFNVSVAAGIALYGLTT